MQSNLWRLYAYTILDEMLFWTAIIVPFLSGFGLSMQEIVFTEMAFASAVMLLEIPSGYFADIYGRKISINIGVFLILIGFSFYAFGNDFIYFVIGGALWGAGMSFSSGANEALLYETLIELKRENEYKKISGDIFFYGRISAIFASFIGGIIASYSIIYSVYATFIPYFANLLISLGLKETRHYQKQTEDLNKFIVIFKESFLHNPKIRTMIFYSSFLGFLSIDYFFKQKYFEFIGVPILYFGFIIGIAPVFSALGSKFAEKIENYFGNKFVLIFIPIIPIFVWISTGLIKSIFIIPFLIVINFLWGFSLVIFNDYIQKLISSDRRATIMSLMGLSRRGIFFIFAPLLGWLADIYTIQTAYLLLAGILFCFSVTNFYFLRKFKII